MVTEWTQEERDSIISHVEAINQLAEKQQLDAYAKSNIEPDDGLIILQIHEYADGWFVRLRDDFLQSSLAIIDNPTTSLPHILKAMQKGMDILDAVDFEKVRTALDLLGYHADAGN